MTAWIYAESQLWSRIAAWFAGIKSEFVLNFITKNRWRMLLNGLGTTLLITLFSCLMGIAIGVVVSIVRSTWDKAGADMRPGFSRGLLRVLNRIAVIYLTVIRGTPVVDPADDRLLRHLRLFQQRRAGGHAGLRLKLRRVCGRDHPRRHHVHRQGPV